MILYFAKRGEGGATRQLKVNFQPQPNPQPTQPRPGEQKYGNSGSPAMPASDERNNSLRMPSHEGAAVLLLPPAQARAGREKKRRACAPKLVRIGAARRRGVSAARSAAGHRAAAVTPDRSQAG